MTPDEMELRILQLENQLARLAEAVQRLAGQLVAVTDALSVPHTNVVGRMQGL